MIQINIVAATFNEFEEFVALMGFAEKSRLKFVHSAHDLLTVRGGVMFVLPKWERNLRYNEFEELASAMAHFEYTYGGQVFRIDPFKFR